MNERTGARGAPGGANNSWQTPTSDEGRKGSGGVHRVCAPIRSPHARCSQLCGDLIAARKVQGVEEELLPSFDLISRSFWTSANGGLLALQPPSAHLARFWPASAGRPAQDQPRQHPRDRRAHLQRHRRLGRCIHHLARARPSPLDHRTDRPSERPI